MKQEKHPKPPERLRGLVSELEEVGDWFAARKGCFHHRHTLDARFARVRQLDKILESLVDNGTIQRMYVTSHDKSRAPGAYYGAL